MSNTTNRNYPKPQASQKLKDDVLKLRQALDAIDLDIEDLVQRTQEIVSSDSPAFSGTPTVPTAPEDNVSSRIANTQFVHNAIANVSGFVTTSTFNSTLGNFLLKSSNETLEIGNYLKLNDDDGEDDFWIHVNINKFYILTDRDGDGAGDGPNPFELDNTQSLAYAYGERLAKHSELRAFTASTGEPSGGNDGDIHLKYIA